MTYCTVILEIKHTLHPLLYCNKQTTVWVIQNSCYATPGKCWSLWAGCEWPSLDTRSVPGGKKLHVRYFADLILRSQKESRLFFPFYRWGTEKLKNRVYYGTHTGATSSLPFGVKVDTSKGSHELWELLRLWITWWKKYTDNSPCNSSMALVLLRGSSQLDPFPTYCTVPVLWSLIIHEI